MPGPLDRSLRLPDTEYVPGSQPKTGIAIHHTVGGSARSTFRWWLADKTIDGRPEITGTAYTIDLDGTVFWPRWWTSCAPASRSRAGTRTGPSTTVCSRGPSTSRRNRRMHMGLRTAGASSSTSELASSATELACSVAEWACSAVEKACSGVRHAFPAPEKTCSGPEQARPAFRKPSPEPVLGSSVSGQASSATEQASSAAGETAPGWPQAWPRPPPASAAP